MTRRRVAAWLAGVLVGGPLVAQDAPARVRIAVLVTDSAGAPIPTARVYAGGSDSARVDRAGRAEFGLPPGPRVFWASSMGYAPLVRRITVTRDTAFAMVLVPAPDASGPTAGKGEVAVDVPTAVPVIAAVVVRDAASIDEGPLRVETTGAEEIAEKAAMTPGDLTMLLNETPGVAVRASAPSLGSAGPRILGLRSRYTLVLADGLPQFGAAFGGITPLQVPPLELERVEFVKGATSALYGPFALGGVVNLVSRRPTGDERTALVNATSRGGVDAVAMDHRIWRPGLSHALLVGVHTQTRRDLDGDAWADLPEYRRVVARPRVWWQRARWSGLVTAGVTAEDREGGRRDGPAPSVEALDSRRVDVGTVARRVTARGLWTLKAAAVERREAHRLGGAPEDDRHQTLFAEGSYTQAIERMGTVVVGAAAQRERYRNDATSVLDAEEGVAGVFGQLTADGAGRLGAAGATRLDLVEGRGAFLTWRLALLARVTDAVSARVTVATGLATPQVTGEGVDAIGARAVQGPVALRVERSRTAIVDLDVATGVVDWALVAHWTRIADPVAEVDAGTGARRVRFVSAPRPSAAWGAELRAAYRRELRAGVGLELRASAGWLRAREWGGDAVGMREVPLTARTSGSAHAVWQWDGWRAGVEWYHVGRQALDEDPVFDRAPTYHLWGLLVQREWRAATLFVNGENLGNVRQTRWAPLPRSVPGLGGRRTVDGWAPLDGRVVNAGVRFPLG